MSMSESSIPETGSIVPKKAYGQNFLISASAIATIVNAAKAGTATRLLEIGPGMGALTIPLLSTCQPLTAIDLDDEVCAYLGERLAGQPNFHLIHGDAVQVPLPEGEPWAVVGNLPYNAATAILTRFLLEPIPWERMVLMFQLEVGQKLLGKPGEKNYGPLSILAQLTTRMTRLMKLGPGAFRPAPKVDSVVLLFEPRADAPDHALRRELLATLHRSFAHRRKTLANNWGGEIEAVLEAEGLPPAIRAEAVPPQAWLSLHRAFQIVRSHDSSHDPL